MNKYAILDDESKVAKICKAVIMIFLPLVACILMCAFDGKTIMDLFMPASLWNDELLYYKQVEAAVEYGQPLGYFGYNESHASVSTFSTWGPVVLLPWVIWGKIFGWNFWSPIVCNLVFMMVVFALFYFWSKPTWKQVLSIVIMYCAFVPITRYILSGMPEIYLYGFSILFFVMARRCMEEFSHKFFWAMLVLIPFLVLMRPYMLVFIIFPAIIAWRKNKKLEIPVALVGAGSFVLYFVYTNLFCAKYFGDSVQTLWLNAFVQEGFLKGIKTTLWLMWQSTVVFGQTVWEGIVTKVPRGTFCVIFLVCFIFICITMLERRKKNRTDFILLLAILFSYICMFGAVLLIYPQMQPAAKHFLVFAALGIFVVGTYSRFFPVKEIVFVCICLYLFTGSFNHNEDLVFELQYYGTDVAEECSYWEKEMEQFAEATDGEVKEEDYTILWVHSDVDLEGNGKLTSWQGLYMLPSGFGINCCTRDYILGNIDSLQAKYLYVSVGGQIEAAAEQRQWKEIGRTEETVCYQLR